VGHSDRGEISKRHTEMDIRHPSSRSMSKAGSNTAISVSNTRGINTPEPRPIPKASSIQTSRIFAPNASIVLVGIRGCGKTSLGYIAARALGRRLVEADDEFEKKTGLSRAQFLKVNGQNAEEYRRQERMVMESMLAKNERDAVIVCGVGSIEFHGQMLLRKFAVDHPVIHVIRETEYIREWLRIPREVNLVQRLEQSDRKHRFCSNYEFFNLFDGGSEPGILDGRVSRDEVIGSGQRSPTYTGTLQRTQQDFIRFINLIMGFPDRPLQVLGSKISAAMSATLDRVHTYALSVKFSQLDSAAIDVTELECGADAVELELDASDVLGQSVAADSAWITTLSKRVAILRRKIAAPIIFHVNNSSSMQISTQSRRLQHEVYMELLHLGIRMGAEFVTLDTEIDQQSARQLFSAKGSCAIIGDHFESSESKRGWDDPNRLQKYHTAAQLGCDIVRLRQFASSAEDNIAVQKFRQHLSSQQSSWPPLIAYNLGRLGRASMCTNTILTSVTHLVLRGSVLDRHQALLTLPEITKMTYDLGLLDPQYFCIFGASVLYSLSPALHNAGYRSLGLPHEYTFRQSSAIHDIDALQSDPSFGGAAIALPYKMEVLNHVNSMSEEASAIGAANTIIPIRASSTETIKAHTAELKGWHAENTDWIGITTCIRQNLSPANIIRPWTSGLVLGAGGMARAAIYALIRLDVPNIFICNRTVSKAEQLAVHFTKVAVSYRNTQRSPNARNVKHRIQVIKSFQEPWPKDFQQPTILVSCVPAHSIGGSPAANLTVPILWLQSTNGGVVLEVSSFQPLWQYIPAKIRNTACL
jgi:3-dehydroquinate dehydratase type I